MKSPIIVLIATLLLPLFGGTARIDLIAPKANLMLISKESDMSGDMTFAAPRWMKSDMATPDVLAGTALDLSRWPRYSLEKDGPIELSGDGHFVFRNLPEVPVRLLGFNAFPRVFSWGEDKERAKQEIDRICRQAKMQGYDFFRTNFKLDEDPFQGAPNDFEFNPVYLDYLDYLIASCRNHGLFIWGTLTSYQMGRKARPTVFALRNDLKALTWYGEPQARAEWERVVKMLLNHINPYTGLAYKDDPVFFAFEPYNEMEVGADAYVSQQGRLKPETISWITTKYEAFLRGMGKTPATAAGADLEEFRNRNGRECMEFFRRVIRETGCKTPVSQFNLNPSLNDSELRNELCEVVSINTYFQHPSQVIQPGSFCRQHSSLSPGGLSYWQRCIGVRLSGKPLVVTEYNHCYWNKFSYEGGIAFGAYSALQGIDGITVHQSPVLAENKLRVPECFTVATNPTMRANLFLTAALYRRGDVKSSPNRIELIIPEVLMKNRAAGAKAVNPEQLQLALLTGFSIRMPGGMAAKSAWTFPLVGSAGISGGEWSSTVGKAEGAVFELDKAVEELRKRNFLPPDNPTRVKNRVFASGTGEITLEQQLLRLKVITPKTEAVTLRPDDSGVSLQNLHIDSVSAGSCIAAVALDDLPLEKSERIMLVINTDSVADGLVLSNDRIVLKKAGNALPPLMETIRATGSLRNSSGRSFRLYPLSLAGERRDELPLKQEGNKLTFSVDTGALPHGTTPFFELAGRTE